VVGGDAHGGGPVGVARFDADREPLGRAQRFRRPIGTSGTASEGIALAKEGGMTMLHRVRSGLVALLLGAAATAALAVPASASSYDGICETGEVCLYWGASLNGGMADFYNDIHNYTSFRFKGSGFGVGQNINDNVASLRNRGRVCNVTNYQHSWGRGDYTTTAPGEARNGASLGNLINQFSSHYWCQL
jgi:hypothetical protein